MTQYKNPFEDPEAEFYGKKVKDYKIPKRRKTPLEEKALEVPEIGGYIYVPKIKLYVAKEKSLHGLNWYDTHKELHKQGLQMLTIRQFIDFMLHLKQNPSPEAKKILDELSTEEESCRMEWLDARFSKKVGSLFSIAPDPIPDPALLKKGWYISYNRKTENGRLVAKNIEPLEECLMNDCYIDLKSCNKQGLPTKEGKDIEYHYPITEGCVARFEKTSNLACLHCDLGDDSHNYMGVRAARKK